MSTEQKIESELIEAFRANVRARRLDLQLSQQALADRMGCFKTYISEIELGKRKPMFKTIARFSFALRCKPALLLRPLKKLSKTA